MEFPIRPLLLDCRIELRKALRHFENTELAQRLEGALAMIQPSAAGAVGRTAPQVAYAWQMAARSLKGSHPGLYAELQKEALRLLDAGPGFIDAQAEIDRLQQDLQAAEDAAGQGKLARMKATGQLSTVCKALAAAAPHVAETGDAQATALARIEALVSGFGSAAGVASVVAGAADPAAVPPPPFVLELVKAGQRDFTKSQREFAVAEAMIVTGWQYTPIELLERGEAWLAALLLNPETAG